MLTVTIHESCPKMYEVDTNDVQEAMRVAQKRWTHGFDGDERGIPYIREIVVKDESGDVVKSDFLPARLP